MSRLLRPSIGIEARCRIVLRQMGELWPDEVIRLNRFVPRETVFRVGLAKLLAAKLKELAALLNCDVAELRLDHDPALGVRRKVFRKGIHVGYSPPANSLEHLGYRPHPAKHAGSHDIKTRVRGDRGQLSDIALVKRNRRQEEREGVRPKSGRTRAREARQKARHTRALKKKMTFGQTPMAIAKRFSLVLDKSKPKSKWIKGRKLRGRNDLRRK